ncbi:MAG TPA: hypothetical protein VLS53_01610 [Candidatus Dormibacteraeota bacterium]|nr:hypothetical protein [Candidatus Dormibacteraeota bacterium]
MPTHLASRVAWGLTWRWALLFASLITPAPIQATMAIAVLLVIGLVTLVWSRRDLLGSAWRVLLAVTVINAGFWMGGAILVPAITLALLITAGDLWWIIAGRAPSVSMPVSTALEPVARELWEPLPQPDAERRRRASRGTAAGFRLLVTASLLLVILAFGAFTLASRAMGGVTTAIASLTGQLAPITGALPSASGPPQALRPTPTPAPSDAPAPVVIPNTQQVQPPRIDTSGLCLSLPNSRYEIRLPDGQAIVVTTKHRDGCPDLSAILKALQHAGGGDPSSN